MLPADTNPQELSQELQTHTATGATVAGAPQHSTLLSQRPFLAGHGFGNSPVCFLQEFHAELSIYIQSLHMLQT